MRMIITGSRDFNDFFLLEQECINVLKILKDEGYNITKNLIEIISGTAKGADTLGEKFADVYGIVKKRFPAEWSNFNVVPCVIKYNKYGPYNALAGHNRNRDMALYAKEDPELGVLIAFHDGKSKGTLDMIHKARKLGLRVFVIEY